jgi:hypothetical protein
MALRRETIRTAIVAGLVVTAYWSADFLVPWLVANPSFEPTYIGFSIGFCIGQLNLIAAWAALAPGNVAIRLPWSLLMTLMMWYALVVGNRVIHPHFPLDQAIFLGIVLLGGCGVAQLPLWGASRLARVRLTRDETMDAFRGQFRLMHLLVGMVFLSLALAPLRAVSPPEGELWRRDLPVMDVLSVLGAVALCNLLITVPCIWGAFLPAKLLVPVAAGWVVYCGVLSIVEMGIIGVLTAPPVYEMDFLWAVFLCNLTQCLVVIGPLLVFRAIGFRLVSVKRGVKGVEA